MIDFEPINYRHLIEARALGWGGWDEWSEARLRYLPMLGYAARIDGALVGVGCVVWVGTMSTGRAIGCFSITEDFRKSKHSRWVLRQAIEVLALAHRATPHIYATPDLTIPGALEFMRRLGFEETGGEEWVHDVRGSSNCTNGFVHPLERDGDPERGGRDSRRGRDV